MFLLYFLYRSLLLTLTAMNLEVQKMTCKNEFIARIEQHRKSILKASATFNENFACSGHFIQKRFYTRARIRGIRVSQLAEIPILFHDWWGSLN